MTTWPSIAKITKADKDTLRGWYASPEFAPNTREERDTLILIATRLCEIRSGIELPAPEGFRQLAEASATATKAAAWFKQIDK